MSIRSARGFTLAELILLIVVISVALAGVMLVFSNAVRGSADPLVTKQALAIAEGLLEEIQLNSYDVVPGTDVGGSRAGFNDVRDYAGYSTVPGGLGILDINGAAIGLDAYDVTVAGPIVPVALGPAGNLVGEALLITVTATGPNGVSVTLIGYRVKYP